MSGFSIVGITVFEPVTYVLRHSFATVLKNEKEASIEEISELLNHSDIKVTEVYLKKFPQKHLDKLADSL